MCVSGAHLIEQSRDQRSANYTISGPQFQGWQVRLFRDSGLAVYYVSRIQNLTLGSVISHKLSTAMRSSRLGSGYLHPRDGHVMYGIIAFQSTVP